MKLNEPTQYEAEFFYSKKQKAISIVLGGFLIFTGVETNLHGLESVAIPIVLITGGIFFVYMGIREIIDKQPKLKFAIKGLWTKKLGFVDWNDITKTQVIETGSWFYRETILAIYLKKTFFEEINQPDEVLDLTNIESNEYVEIIMDDLMSKRNKN